MHHALYAFVMIEKGIIKVTLKQELNLLVSLIEEIQKFTSFYFIKKLIKVQSYFLYAHRIRPPEKMFCHNDTLLLINVRKTKILNLVIGFQNISHNIGNLTEIGTKTK